MKLLDFLFFIDKYSKHQFDISFEKQAAYMLSLGFPKDDIDRSYKQFLCQQFFSPWWVRSIWFFISCFAIPVVMVILLWKGRKTKFMSRVDTIAEDKGMNEIIPTELSSKYAISHKEWNSGVSLSVEDLRYIGSRYFRVYQPYFVFKAIMQIAAYSTRITKYQPERIITHAEFSFCSSLLTDYCHHRRVKLINVQHGEKLLYIRDAFFHFDECYVWDEHYVKMLTRLMAEPTQFKVAVPSSLKIDTTAYQNRSCYADYKYYLAADNENEIKSIVESMSFAKREGKSVKYRIHPRYTDLNVLKKYVPESEIELPWEVNILDSISNLEYAVGSYTTVLVQAYLSGKKILLNDVTFKRRFGQLKDYGYILTKDDLERLSQKQ